MTAPSSSSPPPSAAVKSPASAAKKKAPGTRAAFGSASKQLGQGRFKLPPLKWIITAGVLMAAILGYLWIDWMFIPPKGNNLYGICRAYIEQRLLYPTSLRIVQMNEQIPRTEDKSNPQRIEYQVLFESRDSYGERRLDSVTCGFHFRADLAGTPWQGIELERVLFNGRTNHGWADVNKPASQKTPRDPNDRSEDLEKFQAGIPSLLQNPPDLTLPMHDLYRIDIKDLQDL